MVAAKKASGTHSAELIQQYDRLIAAQPGVVRKGATIPYTSVNGHMFSFLSEAGDLALRLPAGDREAFLERHSTSLHEAHGTVLKEYVSVPAALFRDTERLLPYFRSSFAYVASLKPKATTRKA